MRTLPCPDGRCARERGHHGPCRSRGGSSWWSAQRGGCGVDCAGCLADVHADAPRRARFHIDQMRRHEAEAAKLIGKGERARDMLVYHARFIRGDALRAFLAVLDVLGFHERAATARAGVA